MFSVTVLLWFFREPGFMPGWGGLFKDDFMDDGTVSIFMALTLFFLPEEKPLFLRGSSEITSRKTLSYQPRLVYTSAGYLLRVMGSRY